jgi:4-amino-4-deoxy-L-arabinose transferase-like glycosyltransferase
MLDRARGLLSAPWFIMAIALALRVGNLTTHHLYRIPPDLDHIYFGMEMGRVARSIVTGHGFASVFAPDSGPTAWFGPVYPYLLAGVFKLFGVYTNASAMAILSINSLFSALTCVTLYRVAERTLGSATATVSAWLWAVLPYAIYWPTHHIWETSLSTFLLTAAFLYTLRLEGSVRLSPWLGYGALWGGIALTNAALLSFLPVAAVWLRAREKHSWKQFARGAVAAMVLSIVIVSPWIMRNYSVFHRFVFPRSDFGAELYLENHEGGSRDIVLYHPLWNAAERERYREVGEMAYVQEREQLAKEFIRAHPRLFVKNSLKRAVFFWITAPEEARVLPGLSAKVRKASFTLITFFCFLGLALAFQNHVRGRWLYLGLLALFPLVYYFTHTESRYFHPLAPIVLQLAVYCGVRLCIHSNLGDASHHHGSVYAKGIRSVKT